MSWRVPIATYGGAGARAGRARRPGPPVRADVDPDTERDPGRDRDEQERQPPEQARDFAPPWQGPTVPARIAVLRRLRSRPRSSVDRAAAF